jgi:hypothetical protein
MKLSRIDFCYPTTLPGRRLPLKSVMVGPKVQGGSNTVKDAGLADEGVMITTHGGDLVIIPLANVASMIPAPAKASRKAG